MRISNKTVYCLNGAAVGDLIAAAPVLKRAIEYYHETTDYRVALIPDFRELFPFVPDDKIIPVQKEYPKEFSVRKLNMDGGGGNVVRLTPSRFKLTHYASIGLLSRILPDEHLKYVPLPEADLSRFNMDFSNAAVFITTYRDITRAWKGAELIKTARHVYKKGLNPIFIGKTGAFSIWKTLAVSDFEYPGFGVDLTNNTSLTELATIMSKSKVVFGMDSGPLHLAFTTDTPVVAGFTNVNPELRIPPRNPGVKTEIAVPKIPCQFCQSEMNLDFWNFTKCPRGLALPECVTRMTSKVFIDAFERLGL
jgi:hypothetical protein